MNKDSVGIIGCGHLGLALASTLVAKGYPRDMLRLSYSGNPATYARIEETGLIECISSNEDLCRNSDLVFILVRPQAFSALGKLPLRKDALVASGMAGISLDSLQRALGVSVVRMMTSGPDTIIERKGIAALYPSNACLSDLLSSIGVQVFQLPKEEAMHYFTPAICLPAALLTARKMGINPDAAIEVLEKEYAGFRSIYTWALNALPISISDEEQDAYVQRLSTEGGITQVIVRSLESGSSFLDAMWKGIARSREIEEM